MKCFNHSIADAVGVCRSCGRALCRECIAEVGLSCSCKGRCETVVAAMNDLVERGTTAYRKVGLATLRQGIVIVLFGGLFLFIGIAESGGRGYFGYFMLGVGVLCTVLGLSGIAYGVRLKQK